MPENRKEFSLYHKIKQTLKSLAIDLVALLLSVPVVVIAHNFTPAWIVEIGEKMIRIDYWVVFLFSYILFHFLTFHYSKIVVLLVITGALGLLLGDLFDKYGYTNLYHDYEAFIYNLKEEDIPFQFVEKEDPFSREALIVYAIDYNSAKTREVASNWAIKNFQAYDNILPLKTAQELSIFKEVRKRWNYVYDPDGEDLYVKSSNTLKLLDEDDKLKGDCDDYSIVMAGLIKAIGGEVQLVRTLITNPDSTVTGHLYPEVKIGTKKDLELVAYLIKNELFKKEAKGKPIYYYIDKNGDVWLNFDYFDFYPGGKYPSKVRVSVLKV